MFNYKTITTKMGTDLYEPFTHPVTGETFECTYYDEHVYRMNWTVAPKGYVPFEHIHYFQDEIFYVKEGTLKLVIDGREQLLKPGEKGVVPRGKAHLAENYGDELLTCEVEYIPGLDYYPFFQCFIGLLKDGEYDKKGQMSVPKMAYFMDKMKCNALARPTAIPRPLFKFVLKFFGVAGSVLGWNKQLQKYTGR